jgi:phage protein D/phage baseplate assembly protein gpV
VEQGLHLPSVCSLRIQDDDLSLVDGQTFDVGRTLKVEMGTGNQLRAVFDGEIVALELQPTPAGTLTTVVRGADKSHRLHRGRQTRSFVQVTDSDMATRIAREVGLQPGVESTSEVYDYVLQDNQTNYEFLRQRAERIGFAFWVSAGRLNFRRPSADAPPPITLEWGRTLTRFHPVLSAGRQVNEVVVRGWDPQAKRAIVGRASQARGAPEIGERQAGGALARDAFGEAKSVVVNRPVRTQGEADALAQAICDEIGSTFVRADGTAAGNSEIAPGKLLDVRNLGQRFSGRYMVTQATHVLDNRSGGYRTQFVVCGSQAQTLLDLVRPAGLDGTGREWIALGVVTDNRDPDTMGRVKVQLPWLGDNVESTWARTASPMAGSERGLLYLPEVGDEVLVGFEHGDIHRPYILGALWNGQEQPPRADKDPVDGSGRVVQRIIKSRAGHVILLDDSDGGGGITIQDKSGNKIVLETASNALKITVQGNLEIESQGKVTIKGTAGVDIQSSGQVNVKGAMVNLN